MPSWDWPQAREVVRDQFRRWTVRTAATSGAGRAAAWTASTLPRRRVSDRPQAVQMHPYVGRRLAILAHYSVAGEVDPAFSQLGQALKELGYGVLVATTAPAPLDDIAQRLSPFAFAVVSRGNQGFDFQSWRRGLELCRIKGLSFDRLILTNGSMYGPMSPIDHILSAMDRHQSWGMTESDDFHRHIQSWWLAFGPEVLTNPKFDRYWSRVRPATNKWETILAHELTWSRDLALAGPTGVYVSVADHGCRRNPLFFAWRELITDFGLPFVKRSLFAQNYDHIDMTGWREFLAGAVPDYDLALIAAAAAATPNS